MNLIRKASEERREFFELIGIEVTFAGDILSVAGHVTHNKGDKAVIADVHYSPGYWSRLCTDIYVKPEISAFKIEGAAGVWKPGAFEEFKNA